MLFRSAARTRCQRGVGEEPADQTLYRGAAGVVVGELRLEVLLVVRVAQAQGEIERVGDVDDVMREEGVVLVLLEVPVVDRALVADAVKRVDRGIDRLQDVLRRPYQHLRVVAIDDNRIALLDARVPVVSIAVPGLRRANR